MRAFAGAWGWEAGGAAPAPLVPCFRRFAQNESRSGRVSHGLLASGGRGGRRHAGCARHLRVNVALRVDALEDELLVVEPAQVVGGGRTGPWWGKLLGVAAQSGHDRGNRGAWGDGVGFPGQLVRGGLAARLRGHGEPGPELHFLDELGTGSL